MNIKLSLAILTLISVSACSPNSKKVSATDNGDFDLFCEQFTNLVNSEDYSQLTPKERSAKLDAIVINGLPTPSNAQQAWAAIKYAEASQRSALYQDAAKSAGIDHWECPALNDHASEVGAN